mgnify:CR=1 FL=1
MSVADYTVFGEIVTGSKILVAEYPSKPGGCGIWYKLPNGNKQTAFPKAELEAFFRSLTTGKKKKNAKMLQMWVNDMQWC